MPSDARLNVTVCQIQSDVQGLERDWERLAAHARETGSDLVILPEMPFFPWPFWRREFNADIWDAALEAHDAWQLRLGDLAPAAVAGSRPVEEDGRRLNRGFAWSPEGEGSLQLGHSKFYLPDEAGFWEGSWYARGEGSFDAEVITLRDSESVCAGFLICTELWFMQAARAYGRAGAELLVTPRATERRTVDKWLAGGRAAAVIAGAYSLSSNHYLPDGGPVSLGGFGWVIGPDGEVLALTTPRNPFVTVTVDLTQARRAKHTYPRYVEE